MADRFKTVADAVNFPATKLLAITPNDSTDLVDIPKGLWISVGGTVEVIAVNDTTPVTLTAPAGLLPVRVRRVRAAGTTATGIIALY